MLCSQVEEMMAEVSGSVWVCVVMGEVSVCVGG